MATGERTAELGTLLPPVVAATATIVIGLIAASIAFRQYQIAHAKFKLDLFEKRFAIYKATVDLIAEMAQDSVNIRWTITYDRIREYEKIAAHAQLLFGDDVMSFINNEVVARAKNGMHGDHFRIYIWMWSRHAQDEKFVLKFFAPYMDLSRWR